MPVIDLVKWNGSPNLLAWKYPFANSEELSTWTQLIVNETQEAFLVRGGVYEGPFLAGRHTLSTENLPLLRSLLGLPFGGKSPFSAEVWFVNKLASLSIRWGTPEQISIQDPQYNILVPIRAFGQYGIEVTNSKKFLLKLVGTQRDFTIRAIEDYFRAKIIGKISETLSRAIISRQKSVFTVVSDIDALSTFLQSALSSSFEEYGLTITQFAIQSITIPDTDPSVKTLRDALAQRASMSIVGYDYQQQRSFDVLEAAAENEGPAGALTGIGLGTVTGLAAGGAMNAVANHLNINRPQTSPTSHDDQTMSPSKISTDERFRLLRELAALKADGILTDEEFGAEKLRILGS